MNVYTDPKLLDVAGAVEALPALPLGAGPHTEAESPLSATGTDDLTPSPVCTNVCTNYRQTGHIAVNSGQGLQGQARKTGKPGPSP